MSALPPPLPEHLKEPLENAIEAMETAAWRLACTRYGEGKEHCMDPDWLSHCHPCDRCSLFDSANDLRKLLGWPAVDPSKDGAKKP